MKPDKATPKQTVLIGIWAFILALPMLALIIWFRQDFSERQMAVIAAVNLPVGVSLLILIYRKWIQHIK